MLCTTAKRCIDTIQQIEEDIWKEITLEEENDGKVSAERECTSRTSQGKTGITNARDFQMLLVHPILLWEGTFPPSLQLSSRVSTTSQNQVHVNKGNTDKDFLAGVMLSFAKFGWHHYEDSNSIVDVFRNRSHFL